MYDKEVNLDKCYDRLFNLSDADGGTDRGLLNYIADFSTKKPEEMLKREQLRADAKANIAEMCKAFDQAHGALIAYNGLVKKYDAENKSLSTKNKSELDEAYNNYLKQLDDLHQKTSIAHKSIHDLNLNFPGELHLPKKSTTGIIAYHEYINNIEKQLVEAYIEADKYGDDISESRRWYDHHRQMESAAEDLIAIGDHFKTLGDNAADKETKELYHARAIDCYAVASGDLGSWKAFFNGIKLSLKSLSRLWKKSDDLNTEIEKIKDHYKNFNIDNVFANSPHQSDNEQTDSLNTPLTNKASNSTFLTGDFYLNQAIIDNRQQNQEASKKILDDQNSEKEQNYTNN